MRTWRLVLIGFGTVGRGVAARLLAAADELEALGCDARIVGVVDPVVGSVADDLGLDPAALLGAADRGDTLASLGEPVSGATDELIGELVADVVVEMTPTNLRDGEPGLGHVRAALAAGRHVITTNKGPVALAWKELSELAREHDRQLRCEGTVLSGTPVLGLVEAGLAGAGIRSVRGIVNGTCNFILGEMEEGSGYEEALSRAQQEGYAEADPSGDVEGWDAAAKVVILANLALGADLDLSDVERTGITGIDAAAVAEASGAGERWRLVAAAAPPRGDAGGWTARVAPERLAADDPLARVTGPGNLLAFDTDALGTVTIAGPGAGREATGHAVVADLLAIHRSTQA